MSLQSFNPPAAPKPLGGYSQAIKHKDVVYTTAVYPLNPETNKVETEDVEGQIRLIFSNIEAILKGAGSGSDLIIKQNIYLTDASQSPIFNRVNAELLGEHKPTRASILVGGLPLGAKVAIDVIAAVREERIPAAL